MARARISAPQAGRSSSASAEMTIAHRTAVGVAQRSCMLARCRNCLRLLAHVTVQLGQADRLTSSATRGRDLAVSLPRGCGTGRSHRTRWKRCGWEGLSDVHTHRRCRRRRRAVQRAIATCSRSQHVSICPVPSKKGMWHASCLLKTVGAVELPVQLRVTMAVKLVQHSRPVCCCRQIIPQHLSVRSRSTLRFGFTRAMMRPRRSASHKA